MWNKRISILKKNVIHHLTRNSIVSLPSLQKKMSFRLMTLMIHQNLKLCHPGHKINYQSSNRLQIIWRAQMRIIFSLKISSLMKQCNYNLR